MGKTILLSSHILSELAELCDSVGIIERGQLVVCGSMDELHKRAGEYRIIHIHLLSQLSHAESILASIPAVKRISPLETDGRGNFLEVEFLGDYELAAGLLETMVMHGVRIASFKEKNLSLEDTFLKLTKGEVA
jgi:ABC-2 type transport system ATP-binding protein